MSISVSVEHLQSLRITFYDAIKVIDTLLGDKKTEETKTQSPKKKTSTLTRTRTIKKVERDPIGLCGYCSLKTMKKIKTRTEYEEDKSKCGKSAYHIKDGIMLCDRHKENEIGKIVELINNNHNPTTATELAPQDNIVEVVDEEIDEFFPTLDHPENKDIDDILAEVSDTEKIFTELSPQPCSHEFKPLLAVAYEGVKYAISLDGVCYGKIDKEFSESIDSLSRRKDLCDVKGRLKALHRSDMKFIDKYKLSYIKDLL